MNTAETNGRQPWLALVLSLCAPGLGHVYAGQIVKGLVLFFAFLLWMPLMVVAASLEPSTPVLVGAILAVLAVVGLDLYASVDAYLVARRCREQYQLRDYNRPLVYVLLLLIAVLYPAPAYLYLRGNVAEMFLVPSSSMAPTILNGDHIVAAKGAYRLTHLPERGDVVVFRVPQKQQNWIKRVVGLPGDTVEIKDNEVLINGKKLEQERVPPASLAPIGNQIEGAVFQEALGGRRYQIMYAGKSPDFAKATVPEGSIFVLGDHRDQSVDSRQFGFIPLGNLVGRVQYIYLPAETWERFGAVTQ
jgi:signal peptidase I